MNRGEIWQAMVATMTGIAGIKSVLRGFKPFPQWDPTQLPAIMIVEGPESWAAGTPANRPRILALHCDVIIFCTSGNTPPDPVLAETLNGLMDAVVLALKPPDPFRELFNFGLDGVVSVRIEGEVLKNTGSLKGQALAVFPLRIMVSEAWFYVSEGVDE